jgi:hypothetical protein
LRNSHPIAVIREDGEIGVARSQESKIGASPSLARAEIAIRLGAGGGIARDGAQFELE